MAEPTEDGGATGSQNQDAALDVRTVTAKKGPQRDPKLVERDELLADMDARIEERRRQENEEFLRSNDVDPRAFILAQQMAREAAGQPLDTDTPPQEEEGTEYIEPIAQQRPVKVDAQRVSNKGDDPLGDFVVRVNGKPMFKTLVDGQEKLIPLENARAQLQKHLAADIRLQQAAERTRQLDARQAAIQATESTLRSRSQPTAQAPVDDGVLDNEATEIVRSLVNEPEDKAAARLAQTLKKIRQAATPQVDVEAISKRAADVAEARVVERENTKALSAGFETFTKDYPDIAADPELFAQADRRTDAIAQEHPEWSPGKVMMEAGAQTRAWLKSIGAPVRTQPNVAGQPNNRQQRKENLRPMPTTRTARPAATTEQSDRQSPQDAMAEIRKSRGQPS